MLLTHRLRYFIVLPLAWLTLAGTAIAAERHFPSGTDDVFISQTAGIRSQLLKNIAPVVQKSISDGYYPGAVILVGHQGKIIYRGVFGNRRIKPTIAPMRFNTIFDLASLTKVVATTPAVMQLIEEGKLDLDTRVAVYWPDFAKNGKQSITIRELLTHTSGLPADVSGNIKNEQDLLQKIVAVKLENPVGTKFVYSDINFVVLAHLVQIITGERIDEYSKNHIFLPLRMQDTTYLPSANLHDRIAPTEEDDGQLRWGKVHDPIAAALNGVSGNAGLFSDANDLGIYAQSLLNGGKLKTPYHNGNVRMTYFLAPLTVAKMTTPETPKDMVDARGLGWDIDSSYSNRGVLLPFRSFGHSGWTGTSLWIDPTTKTWIVILTSRLHPTPRKHNQLIEDRRLIANIVSASITDIKSNLLINTGKGEIKRAYASK